MYATIEADIRKGRVVPLEPGRMPESGRALVVILDQPVKKTQWKRVRNGLGWLKLSTDPAEWQRRIRDEWDRRS